MKALEKAVLQSLKNSLVEATRKNWNRGDVEDWAKCARNMETTILNSVSIMDAMLNEPTEPEKEPESETDKN